MSKKQKTAWSDLRVLSAFVSAQVRPWHTILALLMLFAFSIGLGTYVGSPQTRSVPVQYRAEYTDPEILEEEAQSPVYHPIRLDAAIDPPYVSAEAVLVMDFETGTYLYQKNEKTQLWPASTTKVMTSVVALEEYDPNEIVTVHSPVLEGSNMGLVEGEQIKVKHLVQAALIQSANDAAFALAGHHPGGREKFVELMNLKAVELGLHNTHYYDPAGFDNEKQYSTVADLAKLTRYALENGTIKETVATPLLTVADESYTYFHRLQNVNQLLGTVPGVAGVKTGWTENARENLINLTKRDQRMILTVVLGSDDRFGETILLTDWAFTNHKWELVDAQDGQSITKYSGTSTIERSLHTQGL